MLWNDLKTLCRTPGVSGREGGIREVLQGMIAPFADEVRVDRLGNLIAVRRGNPGGKRLMFCAHMDEIGFLVTFIEDSGMIRIAPVGGISFAAAAFSEVVSERGVAGVLVPDSGAKEPTADQHYIDIGAKDKKEAERRVRIGDFFVVRQGVTRLCGSRIAGRPLDDRIGCAVLLEIAREIAAGDFFGAHPVGDVIYVFSVQEEVGCRGAAPAAFAEAPDYALCFDVTRAQDTPGAVPGVCKIGGGAAIKIKDSSVICHEEVVALLRRVAEEEKIPHQTEILLRGGTDTSAIQLAGAGCRAGAVSIPTRYIHSGVELCDLKDAEACVRLAVAFAANVE